MSKSVNLSTQAVDHQLEMLTQLQAMNQPLTIVSMSLFTRDSLQQAHVCLYQISHNLKHEQSGGSSPIDHPLI